MAQCKIERVWTSFGCFPVGTIPMTFANEELDILLKSRSIQYIVYIRKQIMIGGWYEVVNQ